MKTYSKKDNKTRLPLSNITNHQKSLPTRFYRRDEYEKLRNFKPLNYEDSPTKAYGRMNFNQDIVLNAVLINQSSNIKSRTSVAMQMENNQNLIGTLPILEIPANLKKEFKPSQNNTPQSGFQSRDSVDDDSLCLFGIQKDSDNVKSKKSLSFKKPGIKIIHSAKKKSKALDQSRAFDYSLSEEDDLVVGKGSFANLK